MLRPGGGRDLRNISKTWSYTSAQASDESTECAAFLARFESDHLRLVAYGWLAACD
jgi:hypothetical protein